jgi:hypothetical protein
MVESLEGVPACCNTLDEKNRYTQRYAFLQALYGVERWWTSSDARIYGPRTKKPPGVVRGLDGG